MQPSREEMTGPDQKEQRNAEQHRVRGNLPRGCLTSGPPHNHDAFTTKKQHHWADPQRCCLMIHLEQPSFLTALLRSQPLLSKRSYLHYITFPSSPHPNSGTPAGIELEPMNITSQMPDATDRLRTEHRPLGPNLDPGADPEPKAEPHTPAPVSYTHLTLPTKSV